MIRSICKVPPRLTAAIVLAICTACGSGGNSGTSSSEIAATNNGAILSSDETTESATGGIRELMVSDTTTNTITVTQCFCDTRFRSTLQFYHFENQNAVLLIEFDNQTSDFNRTTTIALFDTNASVDSVSKWINNQHSDGLYFDSATPIATFSVAPEVVSITSSAFVEKLSGETGDEYEQTRIEFTVANLSEPDRYFLNGFAGQSVVYLQTR